MFTTSLLIRQDPNVKIEAGYAAPTNTSFMCDFSHSKIALPATLSARRLVAAGSMVLTMKEGPQNITGWPGVSIM